MEIETKPEALALNYVSSNHFYPRILKELTHEVANALAFILIKHFTLDGYSMNRKHLYSRKE